MNTKLNVVWSLEWKESALNSVELDIWIWMINFVIITFASGAQN